MAIKKWVIRIGWACWAITLSTIVGLLIQSARLSQFKSEQNEAYLQKIERSDRTSDYFFKRAAKVYMDSDRAIASSFYYKNDIWITNKHVCRAFQEDGAQAPQIELWNGTRHRVVSYKIAPAPMKTDLCAMKVAEKETLEPAQFSSAETQNLFDPNEILVAAGFPQAEKYDLKAGIVVGETELEFEDGEKFTEQRTTIWAIPGMSGSAVYEAKTKKIVGVVAATDGTFGYIVPLSQLEAFLKELN